MSNFNTENLELFSPVLPENTSVFRQINKNFYKQGRITHNAFIPRNTDNGKLSVSDARKITKEICYIAYKFDYGWPSIGVAEIPVSFITSLELKVNEDPNELIEFMESKTHEQITRMNIFNEAHAVIDMSKLEEKQLIEKSMLIAKQSNTNQLYSVTLNPNSINPTNGTEVTMDSNPQ